MWSEGWYDYRRLPGKQAPPWSHPSDGPYGSRWSRDEYATSRQPQYRAMRNGFRRRGFYSSHYSRQRSPHEQGASFLRESRVGRKDSLPSRFGSSLSRRSRMRSFHQSRLRCRERAIQFLKTSRDTVPSSSSSKSNTTAGPKGSKAPLCINQTEEPESNTTAGPELCEDSQFSSRSKAIASKITEIEKVYRQVCETFGMVVERLVDKDRSLEKSIQFAMKQSLHEIGEQHVEELKHFIMEYDNSTPDFGGPF
ncbi:periphilin-1-like isoform X1 [Peromyscus californicus insignis]|uniref:periphilin-1-like isoform X1 n=1 Tax=Peromyscus californicus insignis TaxID=564181 RepID=UPI0022A73679|nr:periphilin-1-like isoform X1 [Peromyscus californicus insignis]